MARNEEKQLGQLNRLYLQKAEEERRRKFPPRPKLHTLHTAAEVAKHLTSIIKDIDISIKMSQVTCYTQEASERYLAAADQYRREYEAFVRKLKLLDSSAVAGCQPIPWTDRPYDRKLAAPASAAGGCRAAKDEVEEDYDVLEPNAGSGDTVPRRQTIEASDCKRFCRIESPLLLDEERRIQQSASAASAAALAEWVVQTTPAQAVQDAPLQFLASSSRGWALAAAPAHRPSTTESVAMDTTRSCDKGGVRNFCPSAGVGASSESDRRSSQCTTDGLVQFQTVNAVAPATMPSGDKLGDRGCHSGLAQLRLLYGDEESSLDGEASSSDGEVETQCRKRNVETNAALPSEPGSTTLMPR